MSEVDSFIQKMINFNLEDHPELMKQLDQFVRDIAYTGFDPEETRKTMVSKESDRVTLNRDAGNLVQLFLLKGPKKTNCLAKLAMGQKKYFIGLCNKYRVRDPAPNMPSDCITLSRIAAAFPYLTVSILHRRKIERPFTSSNLKSLGAEDFPHFLRTNCAFATFPRPNSSFWPDKKTFVRTIGGCLAYCCYESEILSKRNSDRAALVDRVVSIAAATFNGSAIKTQNDREIVMNAFKADLISEKVQSSLKCIIKAAISHFGPCFIESINIRFDYKLGAEVSQD